MTGGSRLKTRTIYSSARSALERYDTALPASRWADVSAGGFGVSLLNTAKYGYDIKGKTMRLSLLRSPKSPDPTADRGKHSIEYSLYPHEGTWQTSATIQRGYEINVPLIAAITTRHGGPLPASRSFLRLESGRCVLTSVKKAEDSDAWVIQWYNPDSEDVTATLELPLKPKKVVRSNFLEADGAEIPLTGNRVQVPTGSRAVVTVKCTF